MECLEVFTYVCYVFTTGILFNVACKHFFFLFDKFKCCNSLRLPPRTKLRPANQQSMISEESPFNKLLSFQFVIILKQFLSNFSFKELL